jgi:hypothetical protein
MGLAGIALEVLRGGLAAEEHGLFFPFVELEELLDLGGGRSQMVIVVSS